MNINNRLLILILTALILSGVCLYADIIPVKRHDSDAMVQNAQHGDYIAQPAAATDVVYISKTGKKYHTSGCRNLKKSKTKTTRAKAMKAGYTACKVCRP